MLVRSVMLLAIAGAAAIELPRMIGSMVAEPSQGSGSQLSSKATPMAVTQVQVQPAGTVAIKGDARGHFQANFKLNGKPIEGMIDTGASLVAINESTARRLGIGAVHREFKYPISTANGQTLAALVKLDRVEIGSIRIDDVDAFILKDAALSGTLIGLSFLRRLSSYAVTDGTMQLKR